MHLSTWTGWRQYPCGYDAPEYMDWLEAASLRLLGTTTMPKGAREGAYAPYVGDLHMWEGTQEEHHKEKHMEEHHMSHIEECMDTCMGTKEDTYK